MTDEVFLGFAEEFLEDDFSDQEEEEEKKQELPPNKRFNISKIGGKPIWLSPHLPDIDSLSCPQCLHPMPLLLQLYAPLEVHEESYHRVVYVFCCVDGRCHYYYTSRKRPSRCFSVLRCQLGKGSKLLPKDGAVEEEEGKEREEPKGKEKEGAVVGGKCHVCGNYAKNRCAKCKKVFYCSKYHQLLDWKADHKKLCQGKQKPNDLIEEFRTKEGLAILEGNGTLFKEFEVLTEGEEGLKEDAEREAKEEEERLIAQYGGGNSKDAPAPEMAVVPAKKPKKEDKDWEDIEKDQSEKHDATWNKFQKKMKIAPDQVLRYGGKKPLWVQNEHQLVGEGGEEGGAGKCETCGGERSFEFQILPQMLSLLKVEAVGKKICSSESGMTWINYLLDWGTLVCYTCKNSCKRKKEEENNEEKEEKRDDYVSEFLWIQPNIQEDKNRPTP